VVATGAQVKMARAYLGWSVKQLADKAGIGTATINRFESTRGLGSISLSNAQKLTDALLATGEIRFVDDCCVCVGDHSEE